MVNTKGGFLIDEDGVGKEVDEEVRRREKLREKERIEKNAEPCECSPSPRHLALELELISETVRMLDPALNPKCRECGTVDIDHVYNRTFRCLVCNTCKNTYPEKYSLLTKTECKEVRKPHLFCR
jgi:DNA-repair protein complementing XP-A cells